MHCAFDSPDYLQRPCCLCTHPESHNCCCRHCYQQNFRHYVPPRQPLFRPGIQFYSTVYARYHKRIHIMSLLSKLWSIHRYYVVHHRQDSVHYHHKPLFWYQHHCHILHCNSLYRNLDFRNHNPLLWCHMCYCSHHIVSLVVITYFVASLVPVSTLCETILRLMFVTGWPHSIAPKSELPSKEPALPSS